MGDTDCKDERSSLSAPQSVVVASVVVGTLFNLTVVAAATGRVQLLP